MERRAERTSREISRYYTWRECANCNAARSLDFPSGIIRFVMFREIDIPQNIPRRGLCVYVCVASSLLKDLIGEVCVVLLYKFATRNFTCSGS